MWKQKEVCLDFIKPKKFKNKKKLKAKKMIFIKATKTLRKLHHLIKAD
jgi:hypothetical protein